MSISSSFIVPSSEWLKRCTGYCRVLLSRSAAEESPADGSTAEPRELIGLADLELIDPSFAILEEEQQEAVRQALQQKVLVITGGPGTGKTTLLNSLLALLRRAKFSFVLAAPTGRAAKRMAESAGEEAMTIHRLLEYNPHEGGFQRSEDRPLEADVVIIDEASMVDLALMDNSAQRHRPTQPSRSHRRRRSASVGGTGQRAARS